MEHEGYWTLFVEPKPRYRFQEFVCILQKYYKYVLYFANLS